MNKEQYFPPKHAAGQFHCPHCGVYAKQRWSHLSAIGDAYTRKNQFHQVTYSSNIYNLTAITGNMAEEWTVSACEHCEAISLWKSGNMIFPKKIYNLR